MSVFSKLNSKSSTDSNSRDTNTYKHLSYIIRDRLCLFWPPVNWLLYPPLNSMQMELVRSDKYLARTI